MKKENKITFRLTGRTALFSDPVTRVGGEKCTYSVPTYQALKGICESIYWKPTFVWVVDRVKIVNPIRTESRGIRILKYNNSNKPDLSIYTYLVNVDYIVEAHFEQNKNRLDLDDDYNENKHYSIAKRMLEKGGRRDIFLGCRECQGYVEPCGFDDVTSYYNKGNNKGNISFGIMVHGITYPDESGREKLQTRLWNVRMEKGVINFIRPEECTMVTDTVDYKMKKFEYGKNFSGLDEFEKEGMLDELDESALQNI